MTQYRTTTDENGDFSLDLPALEKGTYTMKAIFEGDSDAYGSEITKTLIIQGRAYAISIEANNEIIQSGDTTTLTLSFKDEDGDPVIEPGQTIKLYQEYIVSDIILTSDKDILSYADNDVATLTAKVKTSSGGIPVGVDVVFKKDGVLLDTVQTNTQGVATYSYASTGAGDITFSAECDLLRETYVIEDCIQYLINQVISGSNNSYGVLYNLYTLDSAIGVEIEAKIKSTSRGFGLSLGTVTNATGDGSENALGSRARIAVGNATTIVSSLIVSQNNIQTSVTGSAYTLNSEIHCKIQRVGNNIRLYVDGTKVIDETFTYTHDALYINAESWSQTKTLTVSDLKIKAL